MTARRNSPHGAALLPILASLGVALLAVACLTAPAPVLTADKRADPGPPPGAGRTGTPVAVIGAGADYTRPAIAAMLARDGEGQPIAWDFTDNDARPFAATGPGTGDLLLLAARTTNVRLILVRQAIVDPKAFAALISFIAQTPARIVLWPDAHVKRSDWSTLTAAARRLPHLLFIIPETGPTPDLPNLVVVAASKPPAAGIDARHAAVIAAARAADLLADQPKQTAAKLKAILIGRVK